MRYRAYIGIIIGGLLSVTLQAQTGKSEKADNPSLRKASQLYKQGQYEKALPEMQKAEAQQPNSPLVKYNLGNLQFRRNEFTASEKAFDETLSTTEDSAFKQKAFYNKGVSLSKQKKLLESIEAYKAALKLNPADEDARVNLQKALEELRKQQNNKPEKEKKKEEPKKQEKQNPRQTRFNKKQIEQYLKSLQQKEQEVQQKMQNRSRSVSQPEKDW